ncbi:MAG: FtsX-like permease family protein [Pseudomonadota bacterium]
MKLAKVRLMVRASLRYFAEHPGQLTLAVAGLALGVAAVVSVGAARATISESFARFSAQMSGRASHEIVAVQGELTVAEYRTLRERFADLPLAPVRTLKLRGAEGRSWDALAVDLLRERRMRAFTGGYFSADDFPLADFLGGAPLVLAAAPVGTRLRLQVPGMPFRDVTVAAQLDPFEVTGADRLLVLDLALAAELLGSGAGLTRIDVEADTAQAAALAQALPAHLELSAVDTADTRAMSQAFELNLTALSLLALLVGAFIVFNTLKFFVLQRERTWAFSRMLGLSAGELTRWIVLEALLLGLLGTAAGLLLGVLLADLVMGQMAGTVSQLYYEVVTREAQIEPRVWLTATVLGLGGAVVAALQPARAAARISPLRLQDGRWGEEDHAGLPRWMLPAGLLAVAAALALARLEYLMTALAAVFLVALGWILLALPAAFALGGRLPVSLRQHPLAGYARSRLPLTVSRTSPALAALMLAVATVVGVDHMIQSFRDSVAGWLEASLSADAYLGGADQPLDPALIDQVAESAGVSDIVRFRTVAWPGQPVSKLTALETPAPVRDSYRFLSPWPADGWDTFATQSEALVSETLARTLGLSAGDVLRLPSGRDDVILKVTGLFSDYRADGGRVVVHRDTYRRLWRDDQTTSLGVYFDPANPAAYTTLADRLEGRTDPHQLISTGELRRQSLEVFDRTFALTRGLKWLAAIVAFVGVLSAILALQLERRSEARRLRALGLSPRDLGTLVLLESSALGLLAGLLALPLGAALAYALTRVVNERAFGWTLYVDWQPGTFAFGAGLAIAAAFLAALPPALSFGRDSSP